MSRQNKNKRVIAKRMEVTSVHKKGVEATGLKRTAQSPVGRSSIGFTKKLTSSNKGVCHLVKDKNGQRRVSASAPSRRNYAE